MILLVFATEMERDGVFPHGVPREFDCLVTGVGILAAAFSLGKAFQKQEYKSAIQIGIAGAYTSSELQLGDLVEVRSDCLVEFLPWEPNTFFASGKLPTNNNSKTLRTVKGATVLCCSSSLTKEIEAARGDVAQIETMEGAAFFAACKEYKVEGVQIRAISNFATKYEKTEWKTEEALAKLREFLLPILG